jgi:hypothetical protein
LARHGIKKVVEDHEPLGCLPILVEGQGPTPDDRHEVSAQLFETLPALTSHGNVGMEVEAIEVSVPRPPGE